VEHEILAIDLLHDQVRDDVVLAHVRVLETRLRIQLGDRVRGALDVARRDSVLLRQLAPTVVYELVEMVVDDPVGQGVLFPAVAQLNQQRLTEIPGPDPGRVESLDDREYGLGLFYGEGLHLGPQLGLALGQPGIRGLDDLVEGAGEEPLPVDVADDLFAEGDFPRPQLEQVELLAQVLPQIRRSRRRGHVVLPVLELAAATAGVEAVEQDLLPIDLVLVLLFLGLLLRDLLLRHLRELEERIDQHLLLEVGLQVEQGHVQKIHRLIQARIDLQFLPHSQALGEPSPETGHVLLDHSVRVRSRPAGPLHK
jgi:hypothetical protein